MEETKNNEKSNPFDLSFFTKIFGPLKVLIKLHLKVAKQELKKDFTRYITGLAFILIALLCFLMILILCNILVIFIFKNYVFINLSADISLVFSFFPA